MSETSTTHSGQPSAGGRGPLRAPSFSLGRIWTLATSTFTQLVRMKTFYFLIVFALVVVAVGNLDLLYTAEQKLRVIKNTAFGAMSVFSWLFAIAATAMLLPRDLEDRTLYTILSKPVQRLEYLLGKLGGVMLTIAIALLAMQALFTGVLWVQEKIALADAYADMKAHSNFTEAEIQTRLRMVAEQGVSWGLLSALWAIFLKALVVTSFTLLISTFASVRCSPSSWG